MRIPFSFIYKQRGGGIFWFFLQDMSIYKGVALKELKQAINVILKNEGRVAL